MVTQVSQGNVAQGESGSKVKGPDQGLSGSAQMSRDPVQEVFNHSYQEKGYGSGAQRYASQIVNCIWSCRVEI